MVIDVDLNVGYIDQDEVCCCCEDIIVEVDFYGLMDGVLKFVKGDVIVGLFIMLINIVGGLFIGMIQYDLIFGNVFEVYIILIIGDGLVV